MKKLIEWIKNAPLEELTKELESCGVEFMEEKKYVTITLNLELKLIHQLYGFAIAYNTTIDEVINMMLKEYIEKHPIKGEVNKKGIEICEWKWDESLRRGYGGYKTSCGVISSHSNFPSYNCRFCGREKREIEN